MVSTPAAPFARVVGRVVRPDGTAAAGRLTLTPDAQHPNATLPGGEVVVVPSTVVDLDGEGRVASTVDGVPAPWVDVIAPGGEGVPAGLWETVTDAGDPPTTPTAPAWDGGGHAYKAGDLVTYSGKTYRVLQAHSSQAGWTPTAAPSLWVAV